MSVRIDSLNNVPEHVERLARWHHSEWGELMAPWSLDDARRELQAHLDGEFPATFVALSDSNELLGSASLIAEDAPELNEYGPWLASVIVQPAWRGRGLGRRLIEAVIERARLCHFEKLYLFTDGSGRLYESLGWEPLERRVLPGAAVTIMVKPL
mgnify:FL=1